MHEIIYRLVDDSDFDEYKEKYGQSIVCGTARIDGWAVGIIANQRKVVKSKKGEMQFGGVIYSDSADQAARFIMNCNQKKVPWNWTETGTRWLYLHRVNPAVSKVA
jgi:acetyl-CoA carboxylase carboxyltransferase component